jgi:translocation and assembly module TamB
MRRRLLLTLACLLVVVVLVGPAVLLWSALFTQSGLQLLVRHVPHQLGGVRLEIEGVSGTVARGLHVERVDIDHELVHLSFHDIQGRVALAPLMLQTIRVISGSVGSAAVTVKRRTKPSTPGPPTFLPRWLIVSAEAAHLSTATLSVYNGFHLEVHDLSGAAVVRHSYIKFFQADGRVQDAHLSAIGELRAHDPLGLDVQVHLDWAPAGQPTWTVDGSARGDLNLLSITARAESPFRADITGLMRDLTGPWHWSADAQVQDFNLRAWGNAGPLGSITGHVTAGGDEHGFHAQGPVNPTGLNAGEFDVKFIGNWANGVLSATRMEARHRASGARAAAAGTIAIVDKGPRLDLSGDWDDFRWPLTGREPAVRSAAGSFTFRGVLPYAVHLAGSARVAALPVMPVDLHGALDKDSFSFAPAEVDLFGGHASIAGRVAWSPKESWALAGRFTDINPAALRADLPGSISFMLDASGEGFEPQGKLTASFKDLSGKLRGLTASGAGSITHGNATWAFSKVRVALGSTSLALDGSINDRLDLRFALAASDLGLLSAGSRGTVKASGSINGTLDDPAVVASAHGGDVEYQGIKLEGFDADVNFNPGAAQQESRIDARLRKLSYQQRTLDSVTLTLNGPPSAYQIHLAATASGLALSAQASGPYAHGVFSGELQALNITGSEQLHLSLERPTDLTVSLAHARLEWMCLVGTPGSMCADGDWTQAAWSSTVMANQLPLNTFTAGRTPSVEYLGTLSALAHLSGGGTTPVTGTLRAELADAEIDHKLASRKVEHTTIGSGNINAAATPTQISAELVLGDQQAGSVQGKLQIERSTAQWPDWPLNGELHVHTSELGLVSLYVPDVDRASGQLTADIAVAGTVGTPTLTGVVRVANGELDIYQVNLGLRQINLQAKLGDSGIDFSGGAHAGAGEVSASGHVEWRNLLPYGKFHLEGTNLRVADVPEAQIDASPKLDFSIAGRKIEVTGKVVVPYAKIQPKDITNAVRASADEIIVGSEPDDPSKRFEVVSTITLELGDKVNLDAMGLSARLTGSVTVRSGYDAITTGTGELSVAEGKYTAYARKLDIERGRLIFKGGAVDDPFIDVRAQKQFPDVTAGVNVRGTLTHPFLSFFSDPPLPQSQIVSLILAGGSLQSAANPNNAAIGQAAALLAAGLGPYVGMPDVSLETDPLANETSLVLGRYLSPRLYVSYGMSLTEQLNTFKLRYTLGDHWTIRTELGQARGADLVFSILK